MPKEPRTAEDDRNRGWRRTGPGCEAGSGPSYWSKCNGRRLRAIPELVPVYYQMASRLAPGKAHRRRTVSVSQRRRRYWPVDYHY